MKPSILPAIDLEPTEHVSLDIPRKAALDKGRRRSRHKSGVFRHRTPPSQDTQSVVVPRKLIIPSQQVTQAYKDIDKG